ncbi:capsular polysaccharide synthesis protein [Acetobacter persici]|uniref:Mannosyltransferase n=1 Tax=Acetobacter persici TaxID=1076596 RepID=A0A1U9LIF0_9PROT|nr:capsular polysaccharide synthesis protein [Acetobacter persici]AQT06233.1 hypothetical protein A0U91_14495 [Acetobacter persici]
MAEAAGCFIAYAMLFPFVRRPSLPYPTAKQFQANEDAGRIWTFWADDNPPELVKACLANLRESNPHHEIILLNRHTVADWIDPYMFDKQAMWPIQIAADAIRIELLARYGGVWIDATAIVNADVRSLLPVSQRRNVTFRGFCRGSAEADLPIPELWFLSARAKDPFFMEWAEEMRGLFSFQRAEEWIAFMKARHGKSFQIICEGISKTKEEGYFASAIAARSIWLRSRDKPTFCLVSSDDYVFKYHDLAKWWPPVTAAYLCARGFPSDLPPVVKVTRSERNLLSAIMITGLYRAESLVGRSIFKHRKDAALSRS